MPDEKIYLRPLGFLYGPQAGAAIEDGLALPLAGGPIAFTSVELIEGTPGSSRAYMFSASALSEAGDPDLRSRLDLVTRMRPPFAGLELSRPTLMGIVNVTPDSFSDGGDFVDLAKVDGLHHACVLLCLHGLGRQCLWGWFCHSQDSLREILHEHGEQAAGHPTRSARLGHQIKVVEANRARKFCCC